MRAHTGVGRLELIFLSFALGTMGLSVGILNAVGNWLNLREFNRATIPVIFVTYCFIAWAIAYHRIFDARQVVLALAQRVFVVAVLCAGILGLRSLGADLLPPPLDLATGVLLAGLAAFWLDRRTREWLRLDGEELLGEWRAAVIAAARTETQPDKLVVKFEETVRTLCQSPSAVLLFERGGTYAAERLHLPAEGPGLAALAETGWVTPENLQRRRPTVGLDELRDFLGRHALGALVTSTRGHPRPAFLLAVGVKTTRWPFTYPEVRRLQSIAELMDNILSHARLAAQAALEARTEHLALLSRGLAHDLKNLITPIASFLMHAEAKVAPAGPEAEVHAAARRAVGRMTDYVGESLFFSRRLTPRLERTEVRPLLESTLELCVPRAAARQVRLVIACDDPVSLMADAVLLQRLLGNRVENAIDASAPGQTVTLRAAPAGPGRVRLEVADDGSGIAPEHLARIFEPYFTTKQFGDEVRGIGLGLAICEKIAGLHHGTIAVRSEPGRGTTMTVELPDTPPAIK
jgi:signal transduction histidine kinase